MIPSPPHRALKFLRWFCREDCIEEIEGDLIELFENQCEQSPSKAKRQFNWSVLRYFRPEFIKAFNLGQNSTTMVKNDLKIAWRQLLKQKMYSSIKIGGFSIGISACLLIALFVRQELSFDQHYSNKENIYRIVRETTFDGITDKGAQFPAPMAATLQLSYPEIELAGRYNASPGFGAGSNEVRRIDKKLSSHENNIALADQSLLDILQLRFLSGNPQKALTEPNSMVISKRIADKYFNDEDPIGKSLILNNDPEKQYQVTGVIDDFSRTTHFQYDFLISLSGKEFFEGESSSWRNDNYYTYVSLKSETSISELEQKLSGLVESHFLPIRLESGNQEDIEWVKSFNFRLQPVDDIYLNVADVQDNLNHSDIRYIGLFSAIAFFILIIACVNFINLSTAKATNRAKEVGLRKVVGSLRGRLVAQLLTESIVLSFVAFVIGFVISVMVLPSFNTLLGTQLFIPWNKWWLFPSLLILSLGIGFLAGAYPAFYLSAFQPIRVIKGDLNTGKNNRSLLNSLVTFQFCISTALVISTIIIYQQMDYILNKKLGFDKEQVIVLRGTHTLGQQASVLKDELLKLSEVSSASMSSYLPVENMSRNNGSWEKHGLEGMQPVSGQHWSVDHDYINTLGLNLLKGRDFSSEIPSDSQAVIINQSLAKSLDINLSENPQIHNWLGRWTVIGVVEDFHFEPMRNEIRPLGMYIRSSRSALSIKITSDNIPATLESIESIWRQFSPNQPIRYAFLDQQYANMYSQISRIARIFGVFTLLAIVIACLGLFALSTFIAEKRRKEISIRIVLGASLKSIFQLLTSNFLKLAFISLIITSPLVWYMMNEWLQGFAYKVGMDWKVFLIAGLFISIITLLTVSFQSVRAAMLNPVENLKAE